VRQPAEPEELAKLVLFWAWIEAVREPAEPEELGDVVLV